MWSQENVWIKWKYHKEINTQKGTEKKFWSWNIEIKNSLEGFKIRFRQAEKELVNLKIGQLKLWSLKNKKKDRRKVNRA